MLSCWAPNTSSPWNSVTAKLGARSPPSPDVLTFVPDEELAEPEEPAESALLPQATKIIAKTDSAKMAALGLLDHLPGRSFPFPPAPRLLATVIEGDCGSVPDAIFRPPCICDLRRRTVLIERTS